MKTTKFWVWFYGCNYEIQAFSWQDAMILALAKRINEGNSLCVTFIEDEHENMWRNPSLEFKSE